MICKMMAWEILLLFYWKRGSVFYLLIIVVEVTYYFIFMGVVLLCNGKWQWQWQWKMVSKEEGCLKMHLDHVGRINAKLTLKHIAEV